MSAIAAVPVAAEEPRWRAVTRRLLSRGPALFALLVLGLAILAALVPGWLSPFDPQAQDLSLRLKPPSFVAGGVAGHWLGTDQLGRDIVSRMIHGARITLLVSLFAVLVSAVVGVAAGLLAGFRGGWIDGMIQRLVDMQLAFPVVLLVLAVVAVVGPSLTNLVIIMGLSGWPRFARIVRGQVLSLRELEFVSAARSIGASPWRIMLGHILPNVQSALIVYASFEFARMILLEATLSFLGLGVQPPTPTWGGMINDGRQYIQMAWAVSLVPGIAIALVILAFNLIGDELRDALDPKLADT